jgi:hypothetical protein
MMEAIKRSQHRRPHTIEASADDRGGGPSLRTRRRPQPMNTTEASTHEHDRGPCDNDGAGEQVDVECQASVRDSRMKAMKLWTRVGPYK